MKILYINHVGNFAGTSRSLFELITAFPKGNVYPHLISPKGNFTDKIMDLKIPLIKTFGISQFDNTQYGYYRKLRWIILLREFFLFFVTVYVLSQAKKKWGEFDIIHINEMTMIPAIIISKLIFKKSKLFVHVRSKQRKKNNVRLKLINYILKRYVDLIICIDQNVSSTIPKSLHKLVIHNGLNVKKIKFKQTIRNKFTVAMVGMMHKSKGCLNFIKAANICKKNGYDINFVFYGYEKFNPDKLINKILNIFNFQQDVSLEAKELIKYFKMETSFILKKFTTNLNEIYPNQNVLCFLSSFDSPGRPIFEAGFYKVPSLVSISNPMNDTFINNKTGIIVNGLNPRDIAKKILYLFDNPKERKKMGKEAFMLANKNFNASKNAKKILKKYKEI